MREYFGGVASGPGKGLEQPRRPAAQPAGRFDFEATVQRAKKIMAAREALASIDEEMHTLKDTGVESGSEWEQLQQTKASLEEQLWAIRYPQAPPKGH